MAQLSILAKKTKADILNEYEKLLKDLEEIKAGAKEVHQPQNRQQIETAKKTYTPDAISQSVSQLKTNISDNLQNLSGTLNSSLNQLHQQILAEAEKFADLQTAIALSEKELEVNYQIKVAADTLEKLVADYKEKSLQLEQAYAQKSLEIETEMIDLNRDWKREQEEYEYNLKTKRAREQAIFDETKNKKEATLKEREEAIKTQEEDLKKAKNQLEQFPDELTKQLQAKEQEVTKKLEAAYKVQFDSNKKDWESQKNILELKMKNLEDLMKKQDTEIAQLKKELDSANKKAQDLAVRVIESATHNKRLELENPAPAATK